MVGGAGRYRSPQSRNKRELVTWWATAGEGIAGCSGVHVPPILPMVVILTIDDATWCVQLQAGAILLQTILRSTPAPPNTITTPSIIHPTSTCAFVTTAASPVCLLAKILCLCHHQRKLPTPTSHLSTPHPDILFTRQPTAFSSHCQHLAM
jgi:hypothetical protein